MALLIKDRLRNLFKRLSSYIHQHLFISGFLLMLMYYMFDRELLGAYAPTEGDPLLLLFALFTSWIVYYVYYLHKRLKEVQTKKDKRIEIGFFLGVIGVTSTLIMGYDSILTKALPSLQQAGLKPELMVFLILAPILEEIIYRYLFYDLWARPKYGKLKGGTIIGLFFVVTHPVVSLSGFILYWIPTLLFFMVYDLGGIKASIVVHFIYNLVAIL